MKFPALVIAHFFFLTDQCWYRLNPKKFDLAIFCRPTSVSTRQIRAVYLIFFLFYSIYITRKTCKTDKFKIFFFRFSYPNSDGRFADRLAPRLNIFQGRVVPGSDLKQGHICVYTRPNRRLDIVYLRLFRSL